MRSLPIYLAAYTTVALSSACVSSRIAGIDDVVMKDRILYEKAGDRKFSGTYREYYDDGTIKNEYRYRNGVRHGLAFGISGDGSNRWEQRYKNGIKIGRPKVVVGNWRELLESVNSAGEDGDEGGKSDAGSTSP